MIVLNRNFAAYWKLGVMEYIDVSWKHKKRDYPVRLVSELDDRRYEKRKLEFFANGSVGFASKDHSALGTRLGKEPVPALNEMNVDPQFQGTAIDGAVFETLWRRYARHDT